jgi:hypothetical protein
MQKEKKDIYIYIYIIGKFLPKKFWFWSIQEVYMDLKRPEFARFKT